MRRAERFDAAWHPLSVTLPFLHQAIAAHSELKLAPRISLRLTTEPVHDPERLAGTGSLAQILDDLDQLQKLGAESVVLDPYHGDPEETRRPQEAWRALTTVATHWRMHP